MEAEYQEMAEKDDASSWVELPLASIRKMYQSEEEKRFLQDKILNVQPGRNHPQDPSGENTEMRLYWVFKENSDTTRNRKSVGHRLTATGNVPMNKAATQALADGLVSKAADFQGKGSSLPPSTYGEGCGGKGKAKGRGRGQRRTTEAKALMGFGSLPC